MMQIHRLQSAVALLVFSVAVSHVDGQECTRGSTQCTGGRSPIMMRNQTLCCDLGQYPSISVWDESLNCTCVKLTPEEQEKRTREFAKRTDGKGRMCQSGNDSCRGADFNITVYDQFKFCCRNPGDSKIYYTVVGNSLQYTACRCTSHPIPTNPDPQAYIVPQTGQYNTTGESCSYNELCNDNPNLKCGSQPYATMCCYGSRGMQLTNVGNVTRCTCTHDIFGTNCANIQPLPVCLQQCSTVTDPEKKCIGNGQERCCPPSLTVNATIYNGNFTSCTCTRDLPNKVCSVTSAQDVVRSMVELMAVALLLALAVY